jgi:hypothetical protein
MAGEENDKGFCTKSAQKIKVLEQLNDVPSGQNVEESAQKTRVLSRLETKSEDKENSD